MATIEAQLDAQGLRVAVLVSRFNHIITHRLLEGCERRLRELGCENIDVLWVPGAFELPLAAQAAVESSRYDALVALSAVIRGETPHFDYICRAVTDGLSEIGLNFGVPVAFGVLTTDTVEQALARAAAPGEPGTNKGAEAAEVVAEMASLLDEIGRGE